MSFFNDQRNIRPGPIGDPLCGLDHRVAIQATRILDSAMTRLNNHKEVVKLLDLPSDLEFPLKILGARSVQACADLTDLRVSRLNNRRNFARVRADLCFPITVDVEDANGKCITACADVKENLDVVMFVPTSSVFPFQVVAQSAMTCSEGSCLGSGTVELVVCMTLITKVVSDVDLLIPTYGICPSPIASCFTDEVCREFFDLPLFPKGKR